MKELTLPSVQNALPNEHYQPHKTTIWDQLSQEEKRAINRFIDRIKV